MCELDVMFRSEVVNIRLASQCCFVTMLAITSEHTRNAQTRQILTKKTGDRRAFVDHNNAPNADSKIGASDFNSETPISSKGNFWDR